MGEEGRPLSRDVDLADVAERRPLVVLLRKRGCGYPGHPCGFLPWSHPFLPRGHSVTLSTIMGRNRHSRFAPFMARPGDRKTSNDNRSSLRHDGQ